MELSKCLADICEFPVIYLGENKAPITILEDSGYNVLHENVTIPDIIEYVNRNPGLVEDWVQYSENVRWSPVWSFGPGPNTNWEVSYYDRKGLVEERFFEDKYEACATMIKMTAEEIRKDQ